MAVPRRTLHHGIKFLVKNCVEFSRQYCRVKKDYSARRNAPADFVINSSTGIQNFEKETRIIGLEEYDDEIDNGRYMSS